MIKKILMMCVVLQLASCDVLQEVAGSAGLTNADIGQGLKDALFQGAEKAVREFSKDPSFLTGGSDINIPPEALEIIKTLSSVPVVKEYTKQFTDKVETATKQAVAASLPIFKSAITDLSFTDAYNILMGGQDDAATTYLKEKTYNPLMGEFSPIVEENLQGVGALKEWDKIADVYNKLPFKQKVNPDFNGFISELALKSIFERIQVEEEGIRNNVSMRTTDLMKKVFAKQDNGGNSIGKQLGL